MPAISVTRVHRQHLLKRANDLSSGYSNECLKTHDVICLHAQIAIIFFPYKEITVCGVFNVISGIFVKSI